MKVGHKGIWGHELDAVDISTAQSGLFPTGISSASQRVGGHMAACLWSMAAKNKAWGQPVRMTGVGQGVLLSAFTAQSKEVHKSLGVSTPLG